MNDTDRELIDAFEKCRIPLDRWNQRTHVSIAYLLLNESPFDEALDRLRTGIRRYNQAQGIEESATSGYNETTTVAMMRIIESVMNAYAEVFPCGSADEFCDQHPELMSKHILLGAIRVIGAIRVRSIRCWQGHFLNFFRPEIRACGSIIRARGGGMAA